MRFCFVILCCFFWSADLLHATDKNSIIVIKMDQVFKESIAAQSVEMKIDNLRQTYKMEFDVENKRLREQEQQLMILKELGDTPEYRENVVEFEAKVRQMRRLAQERGNILQNLLKTSMDSLREDLMPILETLMDKYEASIMLDERQVILSAKSIDVTQEAVTMLNDIVQDITITVPLTSLDSPR